MNDYFLLFSSHFDRDLGIDNGRLRLVSLSQGHQEIWIASSSVATKQGHESFHHYGGYIPPEYRVPGLPNYKVNTQPLNLSHVKGVGGNFYQITPFAVTTDRKGKRSDFGIHLDANVPGSLGCIVMSVGRFGQFEFCMRELASKSIEKIPLFVTYS